MNLKKSDVFEEEKFIRVIGKGNKERIVPISGKALKEINLWYIDRNLMTIKPGEEDYVFLNRRGAHLTRNMILIMIKMWLMMQESRKPFLLILYAIVLLQPC